jgi:hypothetical protein
MLDQLPQCNCTCFGINSMGLHKRRQRGIQTELPSLNAEPDLFGDQWLGQARHGQNSVSPERTPTRVSAVNHASSITEYNLPIMELILPKRMPHATNFRPIGRAG